MLGDETHTKAALRQALMTVRYNGVDQLFTEALQAYEARVTYDTVIDILGSVNTVLKQVGASHYVMLVMDNDAPDVVLQAVTKESVDTDETLVYGDFANLNNKEG